MITEEEAKTKWCPFAGTPRFTHQFEECVGSSCMAWIFARQEYENGEPLPFGATPDGIGWEKDGETWCAGSGYAHGGEHRQRWRKPLPLKGCCAAMRTETSGIS